MSTSSSSQAVDRDLTVCVEHVGGGDRAVVKEVRYRRVMWLRAVSFELGDGAWDSMIASFDVFEVPAAMTCHQPYADLARYMLEAGQTWDTETWGELQRAYVFLWPSAIGIAVVGGKTLDPVEPTDFTGVSLVKTPRP